MWSSLIAMILYYFCEKNDAYVEQYETKCEMCQGGPACMVQESIKIWLMI